MSSKREFSSFIETFKAGFEAGQLAHAYLLVGASASTRLAVEMLCVLSCKAGPLRPCFKCAGCRKAIQRLHPDFLWIEPEKKSRTIQREHAKLVEAHVSHTAYEGGWKAVVLTDADRMNDTAANALLKAMEEPPPATMFILLTDSQDSLLPTVISRCRRVIVRDEPAETAGSPKERLKKADSTQAEKDARAAIVEMMKDESLSREGAIVGIARARRLLEFLKETRGVLEAEAAGEDDARSELENKSDIKAVAVARAEARYVAARDLLLKELLLWCRDLLLAVGGAEPNLFHFKEESETLLKMSAGLTWQQAERNVRLVEEMRLRLEQNVAENIAFEHAMTDLKFGR